MKVFTSRGFSSFCSKTVKRAPGVYCSHSSERRVSTTPVFLCRPEGSGEGGGKKTAAPALWLKSCHDFALEAPRWRHVRVKSVSDVVVSGFLVHVFSSPERDTVQVTWDFFSPPPCSGSFSFFLGFARRQRPRRSLYRRDRDARAAEQWEQEADFFITISGFVFLIFSCSDSVLVCDVHAFPQLWLCDLQ